MKKSRRIIIVLLLCIILFNNTLQVLGEESKEYDGVIIENNNPVAVIDSRMVEQIKDIEAPFLPTLMGMFSISPQNPQIYFEESQNIIRTKHLPYGIIHVTSMFTSEAHVSFDFLSGSEYSFGGASIMLPYYKKEVKFYSNWRGQEDIVRFSIEVPFLGGYRIEKDNSVSLVLRDEEKNDSGSQFYGSKLIYFNAKYNKSDNTITINRMENTKLSHPAYYSVDDKVGDEYPTGLRIEKNNYRMGIFSIESYLELFKPENKETTIRVDIRNMGYRSIDNVLIFEKASSSSDKPDSYYNQFKALDMKGRIQEITEGGPSRVGRGIYTNDEDISYYGTGYRGYDGGFEVYEEVKAYWEKNKERIEAQLEAQGYKRIPRVWTEENEEEASVIAEEAEKAYKNKELSKAEKLYKNALGIYNKSEYYYKLGDVLYDMENYEESAKAYETAAKTGYIQEAFAYYNAACSYALIGNKEKGLKYLRSALISGYDYWKHLEKDKDLDSLRKEEEYKEIIMMYKR